MNFWLVKKELWRSFLWLNLRIRISLMTDPRLGQERTIYWLWEGSTALSPPWQNQWQDITMERNSLQSKLQLNLIQTSTYFHLHPGIGTRIAVAIIALRNILEDGGIQHVGRSIQLASTLHPGLQETKNRFPIIGKLEVKRSLQVEPDWRVGQRLSSCFCPFEP